ncbi:zinc-binding dehydrogenase [Nonomuraea sp. K274]|uniref:Zinc-binding dehydrogenase n=1 Tax=Nonomuraea cypriaca TaxID=1187855 RepID=A0A931A5T2_9ACTN|nr:zinc-binding dehydrogenase [Nonomuraea cypriaca]MBF8185259.1 zinc-binding dehydrogenase [Nonomuraea cypriaca]
MRAVITDPTAASRLRLSEAPQPEPAPNQALIRVEAFSLNAGEVRTALESTDSYVPGWDFAGVVEEAAVDGGTAPKGARVYGFVPQGAWAEYVVAGATMITEIPDTVTSVQAAALPVAAVTALAALEQAGTLLGRKVLITGAAGGVGRFACQLASLAGAEVFAVSRRPSLPGQLRADGIATPTVFQGIEAAKEAGRYDVILDGVGGDSLATALTALAPGGVCVTFGNGSRTLTSFHPGDFYHTPGARLQGLWLGNFMMAGTDCGPMLRRLVELVRQERLRPPLDAIVPWTSVGEAAELLSQQGVDGKIVVTVD